MKKAGIIVLTALISGAAAIGAYRVIDEQRNPGRDLTDDQKVFFANNRNENPSAPPADADFVEAAAAVTPGVVHIRTTYSSGQGEGPWEEFYGVPQGVARGSGSGVIITADGYIATNNHVVEDATAIEVVLPDKRTFKGKAAGFDPNTDLALIKIEGSKFPIVRMGNSDVVKVGEWVLAVGYPFSLNTTVTAGIISAKGRSIGILDESQNGRRQQQTSVAIESFIQTDAAINPGNSGGALVNSRGELIGINSAIASQTGSYAGYGFAIPVNLAKKVLEDLIKFGRVKRAFLGVTFPSPVAEEQFFKQQGINPGAIDGVYITGVQSGSAAASAGLKAGDVIKKIDGVEVSSSAEFSERIGRHRPGDKVALTYVRGNKTMSANITLKGGTEEADNAENAASEAFSKLGARFTPATDNIKQRLRIRSGVIVTEIIPGGFFDYIGLPRGTVITGMGGNPVNSEADVRNALAEAKNGVVRVDAVIPDGSRLVFNLSLGA
jgi:serine protease Do